MSRALLRGGDLRSKYDRLPYTPSDRPHTKQRGRSGSLHPLANAECGGLGGLAHQIQKKDALLMPLSSISVRFCNISSQAPYTRFI